MESIERFLRLFRADSARAKKVRSRIWFTIRLLVSSALILWLILGFDWGEIWKAMEQISVGGILLLVLGLLVNRLVAFYRFWVLLRTEGMAIGLGTLLRISFLATFAGNFLPTTVGGDLAKIGWLSSRPELHPDNEMVSVERRAPHPAVRMAFWTLFDRLSNMLAVGLLAPFCLLLPFLRTSIPHWLGGWAPDLTSTFLVFVALSLVAGLALGVGRHTNCDLPGCEPSGEAIQSSSEIQRTSLQKASLLIKKLLVRRHTFGLLVLISIVSITVNLLATWVAARDLGIRVGLWGVAAVYVVLYFVTLLPVSINGLGLQEISTVALYSSLGATEPQAVALAVLLRFAIWVTTLPGVFWLARGIPSQTPGHPMGARQTSEPGSNPGAD